MARNTKKANTSSKVTTNTSSNAVAVVNISSDTMLASVLNETDLQIARESNEVENVKTETGTQVLNPKLRDYYKTAYDKLNKLQGNVLLAKRKMIVAILDSDDYKQSFVNDKDFAESIGETKTSISKARSCINTLKWLTENGFGSDWSSSQLDEITPTLNKELKADKAESFKTMIKGLFDKGAFSDAMSSRQIRDIMANLLDKYNELFPPVKTENESQESENETENESQESENETEDESQESENETENESQESENETEDESSDKAKEIVFKELEIGLTLENGMKCTLVGKSSKKSADKIYKQIRDMIQSNEVIKAEIMKILKNVAM